MSGPNSSNMEATVAYYDRNSQAFCDRTLGIDMSHLHKDFLRSLAPGAHILDLGCGVGRDTKAFLDAGYTVTALDASAEMVRIASEVTRQPATQMRFEGMKFVEEFDGVWACASLLHVARAELPAVLDRVARSMRAGGVLHISVKHGEHEEFRDGRWFCDYTVGSLHDVLCCISGMLPVRYWVTTDARRKHTRWVHGEARRAVH